MGSAVFVQGQMYESRVWGPGGYTERRLFIPAYQLTICERGHVSKGARSESSAASRAMDLALEKIDAYRKQGTVISFEAEGYFILRSIRETDNRALTSVRIPKDVVDQIKKLYEKNMDPAAPPQKPFLLHPDIVKVIRDARLFEARPRRRVQSRL